MSSENEKQERKRTKLPDEPRKRFIAKANLRYKSLARAARAMANVPGPDVEYTSDQAEKVCAAVQAEADRICRAFRGEAEEEATIFPETEAAAEPEAEPASKPKAPAKSATPPAPAKGAKTPAAPSEADNPFA